MDPLAGLIPLIATYGAASLIAATFLERVIPILPSYLLLVAVGMASAEGHFSLSTALVLSTVGSVLGCVPVYAVGAALGESRSRKLLVRLSRLVGMSSARFDRWLDRFRAHEQAIAFGAQMVPTVRLVAPGISGLLRTRFWRFLGAIIPGTVLWNGIFIGAGYAAESADVDMNAAVLALKVLAAVVLSEGLLLVAWRMKVERQALRGEELGGDDNERHWLGDWLTFMRAWAGAPLRIAAVAPSSRSLANLITKEIDAASSPVVELGAGTGSFTRALLKRGVPEDKLILIESNVAFSRLLAQRFPSAQILPIDAAAFGHTETRVSSLAGAAVCGLPLLSMPPKKVLAILEATFDRLQPHGAFYQFTYGLRCPIARPILDRLGLKAVRIGGTIANVPPASVYRITRRPKRMRRDNPPRLCRRDAGSIGPPPRLPTTQSRHRGELGGFPAATGSEQ